MHVTEEIFQPVAVRVQARLDLGDHLDGARVASERGAPTLQLARH